MLKIKLLAAFLAVGCCVYAGSAYTPTTATTYRLASGLTYCKYTYSSLYGGYQEIHVLEVDLTNDALEVGIGVCPDNIMKNTAALGRSCDAIAATNLGFAEMTGSNPTTAVGLVKANGRLFKGSVGYYSSYTEGYLWINKQRAGVAPPEKFSVGMAENIRYSYPVLVQSGAVYPPLAATTGDPSGIIVSRRSRTAVGVTSTRQKMFIVVVDELGGRYAVTCKELADYMLSLGCYEAINCDGGGSSTMWTSAYGLMNRPQNGAYQRPIHDILYVRYSSSAADGGYAESDTSNPSEPTAGSMTSYTPKGDR